MTPSIANSAKPPSHILIQGYDYPYTLFDVSVAKNYQTTLTNYPLQRKEYNNGELYAGPTHNLG